MRTRQADEPIVLEMVTVVLFLAVIYLMLLALGPWQASVLNSFVADAPVGVAGTTVEATQMLLGR